MDLRKNIKTQQDLYQAIEFVKDGTLFYQPFILHDELEVGEARNFCQQYRDVTSIYDKNIYSKFDVGDNKILISDQDKDYFTKCNAEYRQCYEFIRDSIIKYSGLNPKNMTVAEIGCNTGISLYYLAKEGAHCVGYDWNNMSKLFSWFSSLAKADLKFQQGTWDNLRHRFLIQSPNQNSSPIINTPTTISKKELSTLDKIKRELLRPLKKYNLIKTAIKVEEQVSAPKPKMMEYDIPEVDIMINTVYTNHQFDPLQFISYICDRAKVGLFLQVLIEDHNDDCFLRFPATSPHEECIKGDHLQFPLNINNGVSISKKLLLVTLAKLGFEEVIDLKDEIKKKVPAAEWDYFLDAHRMFYAKRTKDVKSAFYKTN